MARASKPYSRPEPFKHSNPDAVSSWKHDLHASSSTSTSNSLASRISSSKPSSSRPSSLINRISGGQAIGKELIPPPTSNPTTGMYGYGAVPPPNINNINAGVELLPSGNARGGKRANNGVGVEKTRLMEQALGGSGPIRRERPRELIGNGNGNGSGGGSGRLTNGGNSGIGAGSVSGVSIMGAAKASVWVRVENLALGTTVEDLTSAFQPHPILSAKSHPQPPNNTTIEIELPTRQDADTIVSTYNGIVADGFALKVEIVRVGLAGRMGGGGGGAGVGVGNGFGGGGEIRQERTAVVPPTPVGSGGRKQELIPSGTKSKLYSDTILASNPNTAIITLAQEEEQRRRVEEERRSDSRYREGRGIPLNERFGGGGGWGGARGRGGSGRNGGMVID